MTQRLEILKASLAKKEAKFDEKINEHFATVGQANGQPLNDKRNGAATFNKWEKQNQSLRNLKEGIEKTKRAIEVEERKIADIEHSKDFIPAEILTLVESGELNQWRKHPFTFFVPGVDKARIVWDGKNQCVAHRYVSQIPDKEQHKKFAKVYNSLSKLLN